MKNVRVTRTYHFEAAHYLTKVDKDHKCRRTHGHNFTLKIVVKAPLDVTTGMVIDYFELDKKTKDLLQELDHSLLNEYNPNPTSENLAIQIYEELKPHVYGLEKVVVMENADSEAEYPA